MLRTVVDRDLTLVAVVSQPVSVGQSKTRKLVQVGMPPRSSRRETGCVFVERKPSSALGSDLLVTSPQRSSDATMFV
jgi:hypothetical protein